MSVSDSAMQSTSKCISAVCVGRDLDHVKGTVTDFWSYRSIEPYDESADESDAFEDGPLATGFSRVFNVTICLSQSMSVPTSINIFFYDQWADECQKLGKGEAISISGSSALVLENTRYGTCTGEHPCCIAIREDKQCTPHIELLLHKADGTTRPLVSTERDGPASSSSSSSFLSYLSSAKKRLHSAIGGMGAAVGLCASPAKANSALTDSVMPESINDNGGEREAKRRADVSKPTIASAISTEDTAIPRQGPPVCLVTVPDPHIYVPFECLDSYYKSLVSVFGVIVSQASPRRSGGSNKFSCAFTLIDTTMPHPRNPIKLNIFADNLEEFPRCLRAGDIICCTSVKVDDFKNIPSLVGNVKNKSSYVVFSRNISPLTGYPRRPPPGSSLEAPNHWGLLPSEWTVTVTSHGLITDKMKKFAHSLTVRQLSEWSEARFMFSSLADLVLPDWSLLQVFQHTMGTGSSSSRGSSCDVTCMVAAVVAGDRTPENDDVTTVLLWDGSTEGFLAPTGALSLSAYQDINTSLRAASVFARRAYESSSGLAHFRDDVEREGIKPGFIYGAPVAICSQRGDEATSKRLRDLRPGMWLRVRNLHVDAAATQRQYSAPPSASSSSCSSTDSRTEAWLVGSVHSDTQIGLLLPYFKDVGARAASYGSMGCEKGARAASAPRPLPSIRAVDAQTASSSGSSGSSVPEPAVQQKGRRQFNAAGEPYYSLALGISKQPPNKFCSLARIVSYRPSDVARFVCKRPSSAASSGEVGALVFRFSLLITDDTMETDVLLFDKEAETFLGVTAEEFNGSVVTRDRIQDRLMQLCALPPDPQAAPSTVGFSLISYLTPLPSGQQALRVAVTGTSIM